MATRRGKRLICLCRKPAPPRRSLCSFTAGTGARLIGRCSATWQRGLNARGIVVAVTGYDLCPIVTIADIIEQIRRVCLFLWQRLNRRMLVYGWSAGGHLTACMVATDWQSLYPKAPADLVPAGYAISGLYDLQPLIKTSMNQDLRLDADSARRSRRYSGRLQRAASSTLWSARWN